MLVQVHLEGGVDFFQRAVMWIGKCSVHRVDRAVERQRVVLDVVAGLLYVPGQVIPGVGLEV